MAVDSEVLTHLFVYGTLRPGDVRWKYLEPFVVDDGWNDTVPGQVFDTGLDYPAAVFESAASDPGAGAHAGADAPLIHGRTFALLQASLDRCIEVLDEVEGVVGGAYRRVAVVTGTGTRAWAYEYGTGLELTLIESGDWFRR